MLLIDLYGLTGLIAVRMTILTKLPEMFESIEKVEMRVITSSHNEQYWSLVKILLFNFTFAHVLAVLLSGIAKL